MTIIRTINGVETEIELTAAELWEAYVEEQHECDLSDIDCAFEDMDDDELMEIYGATMEEIEPLKDAMAYRYRRYRDEDEMWVEDRDYAIRYMLMNNR